MTFKPKFPSYRARLVGFALAAALYGALVLLTGRDHCQHGWDALVVAGLLAVSAAVPEFPAKEKPKAEKYHFTPGP